MSVPRPWVPDAAQESWFALRLALRATAVPCRGDPSAFFADDVSSRQQAAQACSSCALRGPCGEYADTADERFGVWAGVDRAAAKSPLSPWIEK